MATTVYASKLSVAHKSNYHAATGLAFPDVCKTPTPGGPVPIPYPNLAGPGQQQTPGSKAPAGQTLANAGALSRSSGDEAGTLKGMVSKSDQAARGQFLRNHLHGLHAQIWSLPGGNPNRWHKLLDEYVVATAELYKTLSE